MNSYPSGAASLFASLARQPRYVYHRDIPNDRWNVFKIVDGREEFVHAFADLKSAQIFCEEMNNL